MISVCLYYITIHACFIQECTMQQHTYRKGRTAMRLAWEMIREGRPIYGGTVRDYLSKAKP